MKRLTYGDIIEINKELGERGIVLNSNLEFVIETASNIEDKLNYATTLLYEIPRAHSFLNGNKRTAFYAFVEFLKLNGYELKKEPDFDNKMMKILNEIAIGKAQKNKVEKLIKALTTLESIT
ncbi:MAG: type II toxin-antitoxin system death-on-curing family toxin [Candidatus Micrarchaeota archaeon]|nr:type II toxin-antitoxin system death-on-curing family toxin [Candidatus Micrarchaeota archaeon]